MIAFIPESDALKLTYIYLLINPVIQRMGIVDSMFNSESNILHTYSIY